MDLDLNIHPGTQKRRSESIVVRSVCLPVNAYKSETVHGIRLILEPVTQTWSNMTWILIESPEFFSFIISHKYFVLIAHRRLSMRH